MDKDDSNYLDYLEKLVEYLGDGDLWLTPDDDYALKKFFFQASKYAYYADQNNRAVQKEKEKKAAKALLTFYVDTEIMGLN